MNHFLRIPLHLTIPSALKIANADGIRMVEIVDIGELLLLLIQHPPQVAKTRHGGSLSLWTLAKAAPESWLLTLTNRWPSARCRRHPLSPSQSPVPRQSGQRARGIS